MEDLERSENDAAAPVFYAEASLVDGFGLVFIYKFFNVPFLTLQRNEMLKRLEATRTELRVSSEELLLTGHGSEEQNYTRSGYPSLSLVSSICHVCV